MPQQCVMLRGHLCGVILSFHLYVGTGITIGFRGKHHYPLSYLTSLRVFFLEFFLTLYMLLVDMYSLKFKRVF